ncbi:unnamed protein product, partial [Urochloa humidicola]
GLPRPDPFCLFFYGPSPSVLSFLLLPFPSPPLPVTGESSGGDAAGTAGSPGNKGLPEDPSSPKVRSGVVRVGLA